MKTNYLKLFIALLAISTAIVISSCNKDNTVSNEMTDEEYVRNVIQNGFNSGNASEDNLMSQETNDLDKGGAVPDNENGPLSPIDSLKRWGRKILNVNLNFNITTSGDTLFNVLVTRTITGFYRIIGYHNGGQIDSVQKPYTEVFYRNIAFKRVARTPYPRLNWRLYQLGCLDGGTTQPQIGSNYVQITKIEVYINNSIMPTYTFNGPDFQNVKFTTYQFGGTGIPVVHRNDIVKVKVYTTSQNVDPDYVAWHWARNTFGFHRQKYELESQTGSGPYYRVFSKTYNIYSNHLIGFFNGYISASTKESLYDDDPTKFASDMIGIPYWVAQ
jgi:hypothetical protein